jgi:long-subunit acyl-CoA synthetase (AMP-forming)
MDDGSQLVLKALSGESGGRIPVVLCAGSPLPSNIEPAAGDVIFETAWNMKR